MSKNLQKIRKSEKDLILASLHKAIERTPETETFVSTIMTESEKITLGRRILIARLILNGESQREISGRLGVSPNTVSLARKWLEDQMPNYDAVLKQQKELVAANKLNRRKSQRNYPDPLSYAGLKRKYPAHFLLFDLAEAAFKHLNNEPPTGSRPGYPVAA